MTLQSNRDKKTNPENVVNDKVNREYENYANFDYVNENKSNKNLTIPRKSNRKKNPVTRYGNHVTHCIYENYINANVSNTFEKAIKCNEYKEWQKTMDSEIKRLEKNDTWQIVDKRKDKKVIDVKWIYKRKSNNTYKARLVIRDFQQKEYIENVYSPIGKMQVLLSYCCQNNLYIEQMDVETVFLNDYVKFEVYVNEPKGYKTGENKFYKLKRSLYGLRESPRAWYDCFHKFI